MKKISFIFAAALAVLVLGSCGSTAGDGSRILLDGDEAAQTEDVRSENADPDVPAETAQDNAADDAAAGEEVPATPEPIVVHVCGAVADAGVYVLDEGSRVYEAVRAAGGFSEEADEAYVNQAQVLSDGMRLRIPTREETDGLGDAQAVDTGFAGADDGHVVPDVITAPDAAGGGGNVPEQPSGKVNINTADASALCGLTGIGPATAAKIIAYRESNGKFAHIEDIMQVSGIKEKLFTKIKDSITV
ncbi:MAG: helix-hairpin-helix domain-containing protein [Lachnospiraceae bacterium]|nr:helix-hairpin-helix domain-containing protein [Lachnospiraceae bacterium]